MTKRRLAGPLLKPELLPFLAVKGRSKGASDRDWHSRIWKGLREAADVREWLTSSLLSARTRRILRMQTEASAKFAAAQCGQYETLEHYASDNSSFTSSVSTQRVVRDAVLPVELMQIPPSSPKTGVTGYFLSPEFGAERSTVPPGDVAPVIVGDEKERRYGVKMKPEEAQWLREWTPKDRERLRLKLEERVSLDVVPGERGPVRKKKLKLRQNGGLHQLQAPEV